MARSAVLIVGNIVPPACWPCHLFSFPINIPAWSNSDSDVESDRRAVTTTAVCVIGLRLVGQNIGGGFK